jgi:hypothetical protein
VEGEDCTPIATFASPSPLVRGMIDVVTRVEPYTKFISLNAFGVEYCFIDKCIAGD